MHRAHNSQLRLAFPCSQVAHCLHVYLAFPCGQGLQTGQTCFTLPCSHGLQDLQLRLNLLCGQPEHRTQFDFTLPCGHEEHWTQLNFNLPCMQEPRRETDMVGSGSAKSVHFPPDAQKDMRLLTSQTSPARLASSGLNRRTSVDILSTATAPWGTMTRVKASRNIGAETTARRGMRSWSSPSSAATACHVCSARPTKRQIW
mmetsp:Transcript_31094/g.85140  ORF Transcript_31094/g.85140 Transcript_31094/m.85140 type:complete len:201 (+) Transcript_31094:915-1517(+)